MASLKVELETSKKSFFQLLKMRIYGILFLRKTEWFFIAYVCVKRVFFLFLARTYFEDSFSGI